MDAGLCSCATLKKQLTIQEKGISLPVQLVTEIKMQLHHVFFSHQASLNGL